MISLLAQRSLFLHVRRVGEALRKGGIEGGRAQVAHIVGRDVRKLDLAFGWAAARLDRDFAS
jgi:adenosylcobinamide-phosphate synthase